MSFTILLQGRLVGVESYVTSSASSDNEQSAFIARMRYVTLLAEVLPRALLAELGLAPILLGSSGGGQFLVVLPAGSRARADEFLTAAAAQIESLSNYRLNLIWTATENLGDWNAIRRRLQEGITCKAVTAASGDQTFEPVAPGNEVTELGGALPESISWSPEEPGKILLDASGKYTWRLREDLKIATHTSPLPAKLWGVLRGDTDQFEIRLRRAQTDMEYLQLAISYQAFFAEELQILCESPQFARQVSILHSGGAEFAVAGAWDALIDLGREVQRLFQRFVDANLRELPGAEGKTITMALAIANVPDRDTLASVYQQSEAGLRSAKSDHKGSIHLMGRTLEWKHLADASSLKEALVKLVDEYDIPASSIRELQGIYRETQAGRASRRQRIERPWRYMRRINRLLEDEGRRDFQKLRRRVVNDLVGGNPSHMKLRPSGRVALEWARLATESK